MASVGQCLLSDPRGLAWGPEVSAEVGPRGGWTAGGERARKGGSSNQVSQTDVSAP